MTQKPIDLAEFEDMGDEELVVDLPHVDFVAKRLRRLDDRAEVEVDEQRQNRSLGLGVIKVKNTARFAARIVADVQVKFDVPDDRFPPREPPRSNLDVILIELRYTLQQENNGWTPDIGKNRTMFGVHGSPHIGGSGYPELADEPEFTETPSDSLKVGLIDTKIFPLEQFDSRVVPLNGSILEDRQPFTQLAGHGTFSAGMILQAAPTSKVLARGVLSDELATSTVWDVATAMADFADRDVCALVLPLVSFAHDGVPPLAMQRAVNLLRNKFPVLAAAGNHGDAPDENGHSVVNRPAFPAACDGAIAVGAVETPEGIGLADFSPKKAPWVQLVAPGNEVTSTYLRGQVSYIQIGKEAPDPKTDGYKGGARWSGTSFAAATIGGYIAKQIDTRGISPFEALDELLNTDPRANRGIGAARAFLG